ncbi:MAG TPA: N-acetylglucosamine-6-phosphate deacetylase [Terriglobales bacterium]|nr:N-acetylglucosamine-6-phosphate deacetylase [Terriglobales bacterium]
MIAITAAVLFSPVERIEHPVVLMDDGFISEIQPRSSYTIPRNAQIIDCGDAILAPGFMDIHIHGAGSHDVMRPPGEGLPAMESVLACHGVTSYFPTTVTAPMDVTLSALERLADVIDRADGNSNKGRANPIGIHLEGPFLSHARRGVHPPENLVRPSIAVFDRLWQAARGHVKLITIAPEVDGALEVIREATNRGVTVSIGHSDATFEQARAGVTAGARHATHTFNAMRPLSHRDPGILGLVLADDNLSADIILDGIHVDPVIAKLFLKMKGAERAVLISDGLSATGMPDGRYRLGAFDIQVKDGKCMAGDTLAGSVLTLDRAVRNAMQFGSIGPQLALRAASLNPAVASGTSAQRGKLAAGCRADIVVLNSSFEVIHTIVGGRTDS